ncbi:MAG: hypothetical protein ACYDD1_04205, partial [Caulobacteraceae bacterium]
DMIVGADEIARVLGWKARQVYSVREAGEDAPIRKRKGVGIYAFKSELVAWLKASESLPRAGERHQA